MVVSWVELTKAVGLVEAAALILMTAPLTKFDPLTARVKAAEPTVAVLCERYVITGAGADEVTVTVTDLEVVPAALVAVKR